MDPNHKIPFLAPKAHRHLMMQNAFGTTSTVFNLNSFNTVQKPKVSSESKGKHLTEPNKPKRRLCKSKLPWCNVIIPISKGKNWDIRREEWEQRREKKIEWQSVASFLGSGSHKAFTWDLKHLSMPPPKALLSEAYIASIGLVLIGLAVFLGRHPMFPTHNMHFSLNFSSSMNLSVRGIGGKWSWPTVVSTTGYSLDSMEASTTL